MPAAGCTSASGAAGIGAAGIGAADIGAADIGAAGIGAAGTEAVGTEAVVAGTAVDTMPVQLPEMAAVRNDLPDAARVPLRNYRALLRSSHKKYCPPATVLHKICKTY